MQFGFVYRKLLPKHRYHVCNENMNENVHVDFDDEKHRLEAEKDKP